jgi:hypothetical protein
MNGTNERRMRDDVCRGERHQHRNRHRHGHCRDLENFDRPGPSDRPRRLVEELNRRVEELERKLNERAARDRSSTSAAS